MSNLFSQPKIIQPSLHFLNQGICKPILCGCQTFVLGIKYINCFGGEGVIDHEGKKFMVFC